MNISTETVSPYQPYQAAAVSATAASSSPQGNSVHPAIQSIPLLQHVFQYTCDVQRPLGPNGLQLRKMEQVTPIFQETAASFYAEQIKQLKAMPATSRWFTNVNPDLKAGVWAPEQIAKIVSSYHKWHIVLKHVHRILLRYCHNASNMHCLLKGLSYPRVGPSNKKFFKND